MPDWFYRTVTQPLFFQLLTGISQTFEERASRTIRPRSANVLSDRAAAWARYLLPAVAQQVVRRHLESWFDLFPIDPDSRLAILYADARNAVAEQDESNNINWSRVR